MWARSSFTRLSRLLVLELDFPAGARLQAHENYSYIALTYFKDHGLLAAGLVGVSDGQKMLPAFAHQKQRRQEDRGNVSPVCLLAILEQIDFVVRNAPARFIREEDKV